MNYPIEQIEEMLKEFPVMAETEIKVKATQIVEQLLRERKAYREIAIQSVTDESLYYEEREDMENYVDAKAARLMQDENKTKS